MGKLYTKVLSLFLGAFCAIIILKPVLAGVGGGKHTLHVPPAVMQLPQPPVDGLSSFDGTTFGQLLFNDQSSSTKSLNVLSTGLDFTVIANPSSDLVTLSLTSGAGFGTATSTNNRFIRAIRGTLGAGALQSLNISSDDGSAFDLGSIAVQCSTIPVGDPATITLTPYRSGAPTGPAVSVTTTGNSTWNLVALQSNPSFQNIDQVVISGTDNSTGLLSAIGVDAVQVFLSPTVTTNTETALAATTVTLNGSVNDNFSATTPSFIYGTSPTLAGGTSVSATPSTIASGSGNTSISSNLTGLAPNTTYYYQAVGTNAGGTNKGTILSLTTTALITVAPATLTAATVGAAYNQSFNATGGTGPYTFAISSGSIPPGMNLSSAGVLSGTPTGGGAFNFSVTATDAHSVASPADNISLTVNAPAVVLSPNVLGNGAYGSVYSAVTITPSGGTSPYTLAVSSGALPPGMQLSATGVLSGTPTAAGSYNFTITGTDASTGTGPYTGSQAYTMTISPAALTITADNQTMTFGGAVPPLTVSYSGFVNGDNAASLTTAPVISSTATSASPVGTYPITASGAVDANYTITYVPGTLTVSPAALTVTAVSQAITYGNAIPTLSVTYSGFVNGDNAASLTTGPTASTTATTNSPVGTYPITVNGAVDPNYTFTYVPGTLTIGTAVLTITANNQTMTYGGVVPALTVSYSGFVNGDNASKLTTAPTLSTTASATTPVGTYPITVSGAVDPNYSISFVSGTMTVSPATLTVTANDQSMTYGGTVPALTVSYSGFVNGDNAASLTTAPAVATTATSASPAGAYPITASGAVDPNYTFTYVPGTLTIGQAALVITANNQTMTYGGTVPTLTATYSGFVNGDNAASLATAPVITTTATPASPAGTYPVTASGAADPNYTITYVPGTLTIGQAMLTLSANNQTMTYGGTLPPLTFSAQGFVNGDGVSSLQTPPALSTTALNSSPAGTYPVSIGGAADPNYIIHYVAGTLTITPATLTVTADNQTRYINQPNPSFTVTYAGFVNGDNAASLTTQAAATTTATVGSPSGTYPIIPAGAVDPNYTFSYVNGTLTIVNLLPNVITFASLPTKTYGDPDFVISASASSGLPVTLVSQDPSIATVQPDGPGNWLVHIVSAGQVTFSATQGGNGTYAVATEVDQVLTINKADQTITFTQPFGGVAITGETIHLNAVASSGLPITYVLSNPSLASVTGNDIKFTSTGPEVITALQPGNNDYNPASSEDIALEIYNGDDFHGGIGISPNPAHGTLHIHMAKDYQITKVLIFDIRGRIVLGLDQFAGAPYDIQLNILSLMQGIYFVRVVCIRQNELVYPVFKIEVQ